MLADTAVRSINIAVKSLIFLNSTNLATNSSRGSSASSGSGSALGNSIRDLICNKVEAITRNSLL